MAIKYKHFIHKIKKILAKDYTPIEASIKKDVYTPIEASIKKDKKTIKEETNKRSAAGSDDLGHGNLVFHYKKQIISNPQSHSEDNSLGEYQNFAYSSINRHLHITKGKPTKHLERIHNLDSILKKKKTPHELTVYSGINGTKYHKTLMNHKGKGPIKVVHHGYLSTSLDKAIANEFATGKSHIEKYQTSHYHVLKIHVPKGHPGTYIPAHRNAFFLKEKEFLLPRGTKLHIHPKPETKTAEFTHSGLPKDKQYTWHAHIVKGK